MTTTHLILLFLANSLWIFGLHKAFSVEFKSDDYPELGVVEDSKEIFWFVKYYAVMWLGHHWSKPVATCPPCMASVHSSYVYWTVVSLFGEMNYIAVLTYVLYVPCLTAFNEFAAYFKSVMKTYVDNH